MLKFNHFFIETVGFLVVDILMDDLFFPLLFPDIKYKYSRKLHVIEWKNEKYSFTICKPDLKPKSAANSCFDLGNSSMHRFDLYLNLRQIE